MIHKQRARVEIHKVVQLVHIHGDQFRGQVQKLFKQPLGYPVNRKHQLPPVLTIGHTPTSKHLISHTKWFKRPTATGIHAPPQPVAAANPIKHPVLF